MINGLFFTEFPQLETDRLLLKQLSIAHATEIQQMRSHPEVMRYMDSRVHQTVEDSEEFISGNLDLYRLKKGIFWVIFFKSSGKFIGDLAFWNIDRKNARGELGYTLKPEFWGNGLMKEALLAVIDFGFKYLKLHSIEANINPLNENSRRLLTGLKFRKEAYFRENIFHNGKYYDSEIYSLLKSDLEEG